MFPEFSIGFLHIRTFLLCICTGFTLGTAFVYLRSKPPRVFEWWIFLLLFWLFGRLGNELLYSLPQGLEFNAAADGGSSILGSLLGCLLIVPTLARFNNRPWRTYADSLVIPLLFLQFCGKLGCFFEGCCFGTESTLSCCVTSHLRPGICLHPTQLYEASALAVMLPTLWFMASRSKLGNGMLTGTYCIAYGVERFTVEFFRGDAVVLNLPGPTAGQLVAMGIFAVGLWVNISARRSRSRQGQANKQESIPNATGPKRG